MKSPKIPPLLKDIVQTGISVFDGLTFTLHRTCPACGGSLSGYDIKKKQFAHLLIQGTVTTLSVSVRRYYCRSCRRICYADEPFYPDTRIGSIIIDLCVALSMTVPVNRIPVYLAAMGIYVTRTGCRLYVLNNTRPVVTNNIFDIHLPRSIITLSTIAANSVTESRINEEDVLMACGYPFAQRTVINPFSSGPANRKEDAGKKAELLSGKP